MLWQLRWSIYTFVCLFISILIFTLRPASVFAQAAVPLSSYPTWRSASADPTDAAVWGDIDGDGDLDLITINRTDVFSDAYYVYVYRYERNEAQNEWIQIQRFSSPGLLVASDMALGDVDGDGDLDLVIAISGTAQIPFDNIILHINEQGQFQETVAWGNSTRDETVNQLEWGDVDGDGDLDLVAATTSGAKLFLNQNGDLSPAAWQTEQAGEMYSVAWADIDGDQDLDLAVGGKTQVFLYRNLRGHMASTAIEIELDSGPIRDLAWGDIDDDQDLDLAIGLAGANLLYQNDDGVLRATAVWRSDDADNTRRIAWGDVDGDGDPDLAVGNEDAPNKVYLTIDGALQTTAGWESESAETITAIAWIDIDNDGDFELATAGSSKETVYLNQGVAIQAMPTWTSQEGENTSSIAWGDMDNDGDLDLAVGNNGAPNKVYLNQAGRLQQSAAWSSDDTDDTQDIAWGDVDGDGDLDLAVANTDSSNKLYLNDGTQLRTSPVAFSEANRETWSVAWGDIDNDGDLDLATRSMIEEPRIHLNEQGSLQQSPIEMSFSCFGSCDLAWGDVDNDGDLDIATGTLFEGAFPGTTNALYLNDNGRLRRFSAWTSGDRESSSSVTWADVDGDGDLDFATTSPSGPNQIYLNDEGELQRTAAWASQEAVESNSAAWGDVDGDGDLDLAVGNSGHNQIYLNTGQGLQTQAGWISQDVMETHAIAWGDMDGDGDLDLAVGNNGHNQVFLFNRPLAAQFVMGGGINISTHVPDLAWGERTDGHMALIAPANGYAVPQIHTGIVAIPYRLSYPSSQPEPRVSVYFSLNGGGQWQEATAAPPKEGNSPGEHRLYLPLIHATSVQAVTHVQRVFHWDVNQSDLLGQSDNVVVRIVATAIPAIDGVAGTYRYVNGIAKTFGHAQVSTVTYPFRVRGTQTRVVDEAGVGKADALVYRLPAGQTSGANAYARAGGEPFRTDGQGYLQGRGELTINRDPQLADQLVALWPITPTLALTFTDNVRFYQTSAPVTNEGLQATPATESGVLTLTVAPANLLALFDLELSLEWDARNDESFLINLRNALQRASEVLYDVTNGQAALGKIHVYQNKEQWGVADVVIYANNSLRPRATMGGFVDVPLDDIDRTGRVLTDAYGRGQIRMGPNWDPFGQSDAELSQDWWRALAHELAHYLLFLPDNYLGIDENGALRITNCRGSFMTSAYDAEDYSEFLTANEWTGDCEETMAARITGRPDWETIHRFYPMFAVPSTPLAGPHLLPLNVTEITIMDPDPATTSQLIPARNLDLRNAEGNLLTLTQAQAYLFKTNDPTTIVDDYVVALGSTGAGRDRMLMRGAEVGDRLCVISREQTLVGCKNAVRPTDSALTLTTVDNWQPEIDVRHVSSTTMVISVTGTLPQEPLKLQVLPAQSTLASTFVVTSPWQIKTPVAPNVPLVFTIQLEAPAFEGFVRLCAPCSEDGAVRNAREAITQFFLSPVWGPELRGNTGGGADRRDWLANRRALEAPVASGDGRVTIFHVEDLLAETGTSSLQALVALPYLPEWLTPVGPGYRFVANSAAPRTIAFQYLQRDVPAGYEHTLTIYHLPDGATVWQRLATGPLASGIDTEDNLATARMPTIDNGEGIYALMATVEMPMLVEGWNLFTYTRPDTAPISPTLASLTDAYRVLYHYDHTKDEDQWQLYDPAIATLELPIADRINDLTMLKFGQQYWIYATEPITPYLAIPSASNSDAVESDVVAAQRTLALGLPPATMYGIVPGAALGTIPVGATIVARLDGQICGQATIENWGYKIQVASRMAQEGCGEIGREIQLLINNQPTGLPVLWDNRQATCHPIGGLNCPATIAAASSAVEQQIYLPLVRR